jgi:hypothetical protein
MKVFIAGPRALKSLSEPVKDRLGAIIKSNITVLVGDANGVDKMIQQYLYSVNYRNVSVYASNGLARNNIGKWDVRSVPVKEGVSGFEFYAAKDRKMSDEADYGFMIWNGKSKGTLNNIINLSKQNKSVLVYITARARFYNVGNLETARKLASACGREAISLFHTLSGSSHLKAEASAEQISLFPPAM